MFMIVEIKTDTMIVCPPTCYGATVGCAVFYLISNDPRFLTFVQRASIQNKRLALNVRYATDHLTNKQNHRRSNLTQGHKILLFDPTSLHFPNWLCHYNIGFAPNFHKKLAPGPEMARFSCKFGLHFVILLLYLSVFVIWPSSLSATPSHSDLKRGDLTKWH